MDVTDDMLPWEGPDRFEAELSTVDFAQNICGDEELPGQKVQLERRGITSHPYDTNKEHKQDEYQANFWSSQTIFKFAIAAKLREAGEPHLAADLEHCHSELTYAKCNGCGSVSKFLNRCDRFYCPECTPRLSMERKRSVEWWTKEVVQPKHVVLTVRNFDNLTQQKVKWIKACFSKLRRTKFAHGWQGGFYSLEVTNEGKGWHLHIHALVDARWIDARELSITWNRVTKGEGNIVKVKDCRSKSYLQEVTKYAVKGSDLSKWTGFDIVTFIQAFSGVRTFGVFGSLYGKRTAFREWIKSLRDQKPLCKCGCNQISYYSSVDWELHCPLLPAVTSGVPPPKIHHPEFEFAKAMEKARGSFQ